ncbi:rod shape-determining protein RodA [Alkalihalobacillus sp. LMS6]|uniref:FtsW/RodA/SpoVE family cell cycle protein n=1 Tax=Bacillaceae TaxID=186817 RepID=UPI000C07815D|nr:MULTISPECIES: FtsW/RodA/SpoVE family cell cycle protein [Bacillaceae]UTR06228.1 rod shape-determining protein RodA [Alkalihalobacillus sp. LMS6]
MERDKHWRDRIDYTLLFLVFLLLCISAMAIYAGTTAQYVSDEAYRHVFVLSQARWMAIGAILIVIIMMIDYEYFKYLTIPLYAFGMILLLIVEFFGVTVNNATRWIGINGSAIYQPSEIMKIILVLTLAHLVFYLNRRYPEQGLRADLIKLGLIVAVSLPPIFLVLKQPDLGSALVLVSIVAVAILVSNMSLKMILSLAGMAAVFVAFIFYLFFNYVDLLIAWEILESHQLERIYGWLYPEEYASSYAMQTLGATIGIGSGQLTGVGFLNSVQAANAAIPEMHTDFIFAVIGEEFGFIGSTFVICVFFLLIYRMVVLAMASKDLYGTYIIAGIAGMLTFQIFQNIAMTVGLMPVTGIALPFLSYGGSALMTNLIAIGVVLNIAMRQKSYMFETSREAANMERVRG